MTTAKEIIAATAGLSPADKLELFEWLRESEDARVAREAELRREIEKGLEDARLGRVSPLDAEEVIRRGRARLGEGKRADG
jgi:plasmid stabilization system protein ParE